MEHLLAPQLLQRRVTVDLIGAGGNGAQMLSKLARLDLAMRARGHPYGLYVTAYDGAPVSESNIGRQVFSPADIGRNKAVVMIHRINSFYGLDWFACPWPIQNKWAAETRQRSDADITVSCVDTRAARRCLHHRLFGTEQRHAYWLDLGNTDHGGQVVLGQPVASHHPDSRPSAQRLPCITELFPDLLDASIAEENTPSCSVAISLAAQGLFVNDMVVTHAAQLLYALFSRGRLTHHGAVFDLHTARSGPLAVDPACWQRFGLHSAAAQAT